MITSCETQDFVPFGRDYTRHHPGQYQFKSDSATGTGAPQSMYDQSARLSKSFKDISLHEPGLAESWIFKQHNDEGSQFDEELYVRGSTVVWSRGSQDGARTVVKTFTLDSPVSHALWAKFVMASGDRSVDCRSTMTSTGKEQQGICAVTSDALNFFMEAGGEYQTSLPFQVSHTWVIKNGLLFERSLTPAERASQKKNCPSQAVVFSLLHPLDDVAPVITRVSSAKAPPKVSDLTNGNFALILTSCNPSIALSYDSVLGLHSIWKIRQTREEELEQLGPAWEANNFFLHNTTPLQGNEGGLTFSNSPGNINNGSSISNNNSSFSGHHHYIHNQHNPSNLSGSFSARHLSGTGSSPLHGFSSRVVMSPNGVLRSSPGLGPMPPLPMMGVGAGWPAGAGGVTGMRASPGIMSLSHAHNSPGVGGGGSSALPSVSAPSLHRYHTPPGSHYNNHHSTASGGGPSLSRCSPGRLMFSPVAGHHGTWGGANDSLYGPDAALSVQPNVCLELIWTENAPPVRDGPLGKASKAFLTEDLCGQQFLCYMVPYKQHLRCLKFEESNDGSQLVFGSVTYLHAKDATPIESQHMLLILETSGVLVLYSGTNRISQVHIPVLPLGSGSTSLLRSATTPLGSPARQGEVITSSRPPSAMDARFDEQMTGISPVSVNLEDSAGPLSSPLAAGLTGASSSGGGGPLSGPGGLVTPGNSFIQNLRDNVGNRFSVELLNANLFRTELPPMTSSPGISLCLRALKHLLPRDSALQLLSRWYTTRNSPGASGNISEWAMFTTCLLGLMGYDTAKLGLTAKEKSDGSSSPVMQSKRARPSDKGADEDWEYLLSSEHHRQTTPVLSMLQLSSLTDLEPDPGCSHPVSRPCAINSSSPLFLFCPAVLLALHMAYEEMKLSVLLQKEIDAFSPLIHQIACDLRCESYADYYRRDFPALFGELDDLSQITEDDLHKMHYPQIFPSSCPTAMGWIHQALTSCCLPSPMPYIPSVCDLLSKVISLYAVLVSEEQPRDLVVEKCLKKIAPASHRAPTAESSFSFSLSRSLELSPGNSQAEKLVLAMTEMAITQHILDCLPMGLSLALREACLICRAHPPSDWPQAAYKLIGRQDLSELASLKPGTPSFIPSQPVGKDREEVDKEDEDGMENLDEEVLRLCFPRDLRVQEVRKLLQSARPVPITIKQLPEVSDHYFIEKQEKVLLGTCVRTMALPLGRGIFTLHTGQPVLTETLPIPKLCLQGRAPPRNTTVDLTRVDVPANMSVWPQFHNGVAAGLRIADTTQVDCAWIIYNRPKELTNEFAGFLMALGLNGHLPNLSNFNIYEYISEGSELVCIGILLGMSAAKRGSMDQIVTKALSVHVSPLLPQNSMELNIPHNTRVAAIMGVGLLYQGTGHMYMAEVMLMEIGRPPGPEMENYQDRESYALSAGLALGLIMFGRGNQTTGLSDLSMADLLCHLMVGGHTKQLWSNNRNRVYRAPSFLIKEGDRVNVDVTSPGATLALGMIFFNTNNSAVSEWLRAPDTQFMLEQVRPDFLCLRTISYGLVNWDYVLPSPNWIKSNVPQIVQKYAFYRPKPGNDDDLDPSIDIQTMSQAYCNITLGACLVLAFKFAGTGNTEAFKAILESFGQSMKLLGDQYIYEQTGRSTLENTVTTKLLALAIVMAGTGNLITLKICRAMRRRVGPQHPQITYGNHMAIAMATGLLFMGGGKLSMKTTPEAIGAMLCAFYPHFPISSTDNKFHLQALRHLYVLACEPRLVIPRDVDTGKFVFVPLRIKFKGCKAYKTTTFTADAPYNVPELSKLDEIQIIGTRYWPIVFREDKNWETLKLLLAKGGVLPVKQRAGHLSYVEDPKGYRSELVKSLIADHSCHFSSQLDVVKSFTSDARITTLTELFVTQESTDKELLQELNSIIYQSVTQEKAEAILPHMVLRHLCQQLNTGGMSTLGLQQLRFVQVYYESRHQLASCQHQSKAQGEAICTGHLHSQFLLSLRNRVEKRLRQWMNGHTETVIAYLRGQRVPEEEYRELAQATVWFSLPNKMEVAAAGLTECPSIPVLAKIFPHLSMPGLLRMHRLLKAAE